jgi:hypothetical protein
LPCSAVGNIQNPSFESGHLGGSLEGWDIYRTTNETTGPTSRVTVESVHHFDDQYSGSSVSGHSAHLSVQPGEAVVMFNVITGVCPGSPITSSIRVLLEAAPTCDVYFGMIPSQNEASKFYPTLQNTAIQTSVAAAGYAPGVTWINLSVTDVMLVNTTSGALVFAVDCTNPTYTTAANYWIDYAFFQD